jgi:hypothetical protein
MTNLESSEDAPGELSALISDLLAWVVVLGDRTLANRFDRFATGPLDRVVLAPATRAVRDVLSERQDGQLGSSTLVVALSARSGRVVDVVQAGELVDNVRIFDAITRAETQ